MDFITDRSEFDRARNTNSLLYVFKHSTQCPISAAAKEEFEAFAGDHDVAYVAVKVIENRDISNHIENITGVKHESPQVLLLQDSSVLWHESHRNITQDTLHNEWNKHK